MPSCPVCEQTEIEPMFDGVRDHYRMTKTEYKFVKCARCGSAILDPLPSSEELAAAYPRAYTFKRNRQRQGIRWALERLEWHLFYQFLFTQRVKSLTRVTQLHGGRLLDVGCGSGLLLKMFADEGFAVEGVEVSAEDVRYIEEGLQVRVFHGTLAEARYSENSFDVVTLYYVLEHLPAPFDVIREVRRILRPGGWVVLVVPLIDSWQALLFKQRWSQITEAPRHVWIPSSRAMSKMLTTAGFDPVKMTNISSPELAELIAISLYPSASHAMTSNGGAGILRRGLGGVVAVFSLLMAFVERSLSHGKVPSGAMTFFGRKQGAL